MQKNYGRSVDWWSIGILMYEMMFGYHPFFHYNPVELCKRICEEEVEFPDNVFYDAKDLLTGN